MCLQLGFVIFWQKDFGATAAHKMLVKLTPEVNANKKILIFCKLDHFSAMRRILHYNQTA
jgi:hypothetical protein